MSGITIKINKGNSKEFDRIMDMMQCFNNIKELKNHYSVRITEEEMIIHRDRIDNILKSIPLLEEKEWFSIPDYESNEWYDWLIDLHFSKKKTFRREGDF